MKTARFANKNLNNERFTIVRISLGAPRWRLPYTIDCCCSLLAPERDTLKITDQSEYKKRYFAKLGKIGVDALREFFERVEQNGKEIVLLCFEDIRLPSQWCHRNLFAEWWYLQTGERIQELAEQDNIKVKRNAPTQPRLF